jgi:hypothetical protein
MQVKIHELAAKEFDDAIEWYELQSNGLGNRFKNAVVKQIAKIKVHPKWYLIEDGSIYKAYVPKFPFKILYTYDDDNTITIWAIAHMHRKPWYWQNRLR